MQIFYFHFLRMTKCATKYLTLFLLLFEGFTLLKAQERFQKKDDELSENYKKNLLALNVFDLRNKNFSFSYERFVAEGYLGLKIPTSIGISKAGTGSNLQQNKISSIGFILNCYPDKQGIVRFFIGPGFETGKYAFALPKSTSLKISELNILNISYKAWFLDFGCMFQFSKRLTASLEIDLGFRTDRLADFYNYASTPNQKLYAAANAVINFGYRF